MDDDFELDFSSCQCDLCGAELEPEEVVWDIDSGEAVAMCSTCAEGA